MSSSENIPHIDEQEVAMESKENLGLNMVAGAIAGLVTDLFFFPLDTLKTRLQATVSGKDYSSQTKGKGLFSGLSAGIIISAPACACYWGGYELSKSFLLKNHSDVRDLVFRADLRPFPPTSSISSVERLLSSAATPLGTPLRLPSSKCRWAWTILLEQLSDQFLASRV